MLHSIPAPAAAHFTKLEAYWAGVTGNNVSFNNGLIQDEIRWYISRITNETR